MKIKILLWCFLFTVHFAIAQEKEYLSLVTAKNQALSAGNTDELMSFFDEKATIGLSDKRLAKGITEITTYFKEKTAASYAIHTLSEYIHFEKYLILKEQVTTSQNTTEQLTVYRFKKGKIKNMWLLSPTDHPASPLPAVSQLVEGLLNSDLELFMDTLSSGIKECDFPGNCHVSGLSAMCKRSETYLGKQRTKYKLVKRMILGNIVIDDNYLSILSTVPGERNIAIYTTDVQGKVERIEFIGF